MTRVNLVLVLLVMICAMGVITSQHKARKLYQAIEHERERAKALDVEFDQLQIEQSTWAVHTRIERVAVERLRMHRPAPAAVVRLPEQP
jgi:cell division protein FtsL